MKHIQFFGVKEDFIPMLQLFESKGPVKYVRMGHFSKNGIEVYNYGGEIPNLGKATADCSIVCDSYLVCEQMTAVSLRPLRNIGDVAYVCVDQLANPDTVTFTAGGIWNEEIVLHGRVASVSESQASQELMKRFHSALRKNFAKIKAFYVGPKALELLERGARLTISAQSSREFDLVLPENPIRGR